MQNRWETDLNINWLFKRSDKYIIVVFVKELYLDYARFLSLIGRKFQNKNNG